MNPRSIPALLLAIAVVTSARGQSTDALPRLAPDPRIAAIAANPSPMGFDDFLSAAIAVSGSTNPEKTRALAASAAEDLIALASGAGDAYSLGETVLSFLHARIFRRYSVDQTLPDAALESGEYNCVSSAVVYSLFARLLGLDVGAVATKDHAFCVLDVGGRAVDVETTNKYGFDPGTRKDFSDSFGRATGFAYVPPGSYSTRKEIGERELLGLVLSNRITMLERAGKYDEAAALGADYAALVGTRDAVALFEGRVSNLVATLLNKGAVDRSLAILAKAREEWPESGATWYSLETKAREARLGAYASRGDWSGGLEYALSLESLGFADPTIDSFSNVAVNNVLVEFVRSARFAEARVALERYATLVSKADTSRFMKMIEESALDYAAKKGPFADSVAALDAATRAGIIDAPRLAQFCEYVFLKEATAVAKSKGWIAASLVAAEGLALAPSSSRLKEAVSTYRNNRAIEAHNEFARLFGAKDYANAERAVREALALVPESELLKSDLAIVLKATGR